MSRLVILGFRGMLGQAVTRFAYERQLPTLRVGRDGEVDFRYPKSDVASLARKIELGPEDFVVNCIGWIPQKASGDQTLDRKDASLLNTCFLRDLSDAQEQHGFRFLQILTDCVFAGNGGPYFEDHIRDAEDLYGKSKVEGESYLQNATAIRTSIIGPDNHLGVGLYSWLRKNMLEGENVEGYKNVTWNGVTTLAFARLAAGMFESGYGSKVLQHWVPRNFVSKLELLRTIAASEGWNVELISESTSTPGVDRVLGTLNPDLNDLHWKLAGYESIPTIQELVDEATVWWSSNTTGINLEAR